MSRSPSIRRSLLVGGAALLCVALTASCQRPREDASADAASEPPTAASTPEPAAQTPPPGRHALTASPPLEATDLNRMFAQGFSPDEVLAAIRQRGMLRAPDALESARIALLPDSTRLVEAMTAPENVLMPKALELHGRLLAAGLSPEQMQNAGTFPRTGSAPYPAYQAIYYQQTLQTDNRNRRQELSQRIAKLKKQYTEQTRRGESGAIVGMEIERLQRELDALSPS